MRIEEEYIQKHPTSQKLYETATTGFPSGITHDVRWIEPFPVFMTSGKGSRKWDVDGNEYIGYVMGHGALILGHSHPEIVKAINRQIEMGTHLGANTELELTWMKWVKKLIPSIEKMAFTSSGTEATLMALRLARGFTGKSKIIKFENHFHGWHDYLIAEKGKYSSTGIPDSTKQSIIRLPDDGDIHTVENVLKRDDEIAGVILEPTGASMGLFPLKPEYLKQLRELTKQYGVLLIFDEVVTGFRISQGGAQERYNIKPDITTLGKILGGGLPCGAVGAKKEIMELLSFHSDPEWNTDRRISHPGTFNANPLSAASGIQCLELISNNPINTRADNSADRLKSGINAILKKKGIPGCAYGISSIIFLLFGFQQGDDSDIYSIPHKKIKESSRLPLWKTFKLAMLNNGVDLMGQNEFIVSAYHTADDVDITLEAFEKTLSQMKNQF